MSGGRRVLVVSHTGQLGGAEIALLRLVDAIDQSAFSISACVFSSGPFEQELTARGVRVRVADARGLDRVTRSEAASARVLLRNVFGSQRLVRRLRSVIVEEHADLVVANSLKAAVITAIAAPAARRPWVWHLHDRVTSEYLSRSLVKILRIIARIGPRRIVANSRATAATLGAMPVGKVAVAYPGIDVFEFDGVVPARDDGAVGMIGRISATKGQREFLDAVELLVTAGRTGPYRIVGAALFEDGDVEQALHDRTRRVPELRNVEWTGWSDDVPAQLRRLRLLVHASPVAEPFGQIVIEAMAAGVPVLASQAGGIPEILAPHGNAMPHIADGVVRGECGLLVRPGDVRALAAGIGWALDHPVEMRAVAVRAREEARSRFSVEETARIVQGAWRQAMR